MPSDSPRYAIRSQHVTHERLDDEVIAIDLERGFYFAMVGSAADIWTLLVDGTEPEDTNQVLAERYGIDVAIVRPDVETFVQRLLDENLIAPVGGDAADPSSGGADGRGGQLPDLRDTEQWGTPELERYDDMADLVLLDPIHQVDESGWPHLPREQ
jgi:hypothetical protein